MSGSIADLTPGGALGPMFGGPTKNAGSPPSTSDTINQVMQAYNQYLPQYFQTTNAQITPTAQAQLGAAQAVSPGYSQLGLQQLQQFGVPYAQAGSAITNANTQAGSQTQLQDLQGAGGNVARSALALNQELNPQYYNVINPASAQSANLLNSINLNGLSPGEQNAVERGLNQQNTSTGNLGLTNATNTVSNALNYGGAFNNKLGILSNALGAANNTANTAQNNGFNPVGTAFSQPTASNQTNFGTAQFNPIAPTPNTQQASSGLLGSFSGIANTQLPLQADSNYKNSQQYQLSDIGSKFCCFIFLEIYNGQLPWYVRVERDKYYEKYPSVAKGYKKMAKWLVPKMQSSSIIRWITNWTMVKPLTLRGASTYGLNKFGWIFEPIKQFWFLVWRLS